MHIGLFFGSFNPIHIGHLIIANYCLDHTDLDEIQFVVSPQNPNKKRSSLLNEYDRLKMVELAIEDSSRLSASNIEFNMPKPSYTIDTLTYLSEKHPSNKFSIIMGGDNLKHFHKWKNFESILKYHHVIVFSRPGSRTHKLLDTSNITILEETPLLNISASMIRKLLTSGKRIDYLVPASVNNYITKNHLY